MDFRTVFLAVSSSIALAVGTLTVMFLEQLLANKRIALPNDVAAIWVREVGVTVAVNSVLHVVLGVGFLIRATQRGYPPAL